MSFSEFYKWRDAMKKKLFKQLFMTIISAIVTTFLLAFIYVLFTQIYRCLNNASESSDIIYEFILLNMLILPFVLGLFIIIFSVYQILNWYDSRNKST